MLNNCCKYGKIQNDISNELQKMVYKIHMVEVSYENGNKIIHGYRRLKEIAQFLEDMKTNLI